MTDARIWMLVAAVLATAFLPASAQSIGPNDVARVSVDSDGQYMAADAIIRYRRPPPTFGEPSEETWYKHGDAVRIDARPSNRRDLLVERFSSPGQKVTFTLTRSSNGRLQSLMLMDDALSALPVMATRTFSGTVERHLGERCRVWEVAHHVEHGSDFVQSGCVTAKGIELWWRQANIGEIVATSISYKAVRASVVKPPLQALDIRAWAPMISSGDHRKDYAVSLRSFGTCADEFARSRSGNWIATTTSNSAGAGFLLTNAPAGIEMGFSDNRRGDRHLTIGRVAAASEDVPSLGRTRISSKSDEQIAGERCSWWDTMPGVADASQNECLTADGVPLAINRSFRGGGSEMTAEYLRRSSQPLSSVAPDSRIQDPNFWGFSKSP